MKQLQKQKEQQQQQQKQNLLLPQLVMRTGEGTHNSAAQLRLQKDITELELPKGIQVTFPNPKDLFHFTLTIVPQQGFYSHGTFAFSVEINDSFPMEPPKIKCQQRIFHPNIDLDGNVCLNILREDWSPVLNLNSVFIGLNFLFLEPNPMDPLNKDAANMLVKEPRRFEREVYQSMRGYNGYERVV